MFILTDRNGNNEDSDIELGVVGTDGSIGFDLVVDHIMHFVFLGMHHQVGHDEHPETHGQGRDRSDNQLFEAVVFSCKDACASHEKT